MEGTLPVENPQLSKASSSRSKEIVGRSKPICNEDSREHQEPQIDAEGDMEFAEIRSKLVNLSWMEMAQQKRDTRLRGVVRVPVSGKPRGLDELGMNAHIERLRRLTFVNDQTRIKRSGLQAQDVCDTAESATANQDLFRPGFKGTPSPVGAAISIVPAMPIHHFFPSFHRGVGNRNLGSAKPEGDLAKTSCHQSVPKASSYQSRCRFRPAHREQYGREKAREDNRRKSKGMGMVGEIAQRGVRTVNRGSFQLPENSKVILRWKKENEKPSLDQLLYCRSSKSPHGQSVGTSLYCMIVAWFALFVWPPKFRVPAAQREIRGNNEQPYPHKMFCSYAQKSPFFLPTKLPPPCNFQDFQKTTLVTAPNHQPNQLHIHRRIMLLIPFDLRVPLSWRRLPRILLLAVCLLDTLVTARPIAVQELVPRDGRVEDVLIMHIYVPKSKAIKAVKLCLYFGSEQVICSPTPPSVPATDSEQWEMPFVHRIGKMKFIDDGAKKTGYPTLRNPERELVCSFPKPEEVLKRWKKILSNGLSKKLSVMQYGSTGDVQIRIGDDFRMTFRVDNSKPLPNETPAQFFAGTVHYWNEAVFMDALTEIWQQASVSNEPPDWFPGYYPQPKSIWDMKDWERPLVGADHAMKALGRTQTGWESYDIDTSEKIRAFTSPEDSESVRAFSSQDLKTWQQDVNAVAVELTQRARDDNGGQSATSTSAAPNRVEKKRKPTPAFIEYRFFTLQCTDYL
ncbi:hypothetical protein EV360DRAFT_68013 [Lentinula raphanica]|nr:hypothetical protein EV360DRAFT_68013 [Lentinula raphanica]